MSYESFKNKETWLINVWGYVDEIANVWIENETPNGASFIDITPEYCRDAFEMLTDDMYNRLGDTGILKDFIDDSISSVDWREIHEHVIDIVRDAKD